MVLIMLASMVVLLFLGFPMMIPLTVAAVIGFVMMFDGFGQIDTFIQQMLAGIRPTALIAVPMFIFAADVMTRGQSANRLVNLVMAFIGHVKGGLAVSTAASCTLFGAVSGSTQATVVAVGSPMRPRMLKAGYKDSFILALIINSSDIAFLIPPSIGMIIYGVISGTSIGELFIAGIGPGLLILLVFSIYCVIYATINKVPTEPRASWSERLTAIRQALLAGIGINEAGPNGVLVIIATAFFIACMFVDPIVVILVLTPIFAPAIANTGLDPVLVGVLITLIVAIGSATPPFGCDIFTAIAIFKRPYWEVIKGTPPFVFMLVMVAGAIILFPQIALFLRDLAFR